MNQYETMISVVSEKCAGRKLKRIEWRDAPLGRTLARFIFEGDNSDEEEIIQVYGKDLAPSFGRVKLD